MTNENFRFSFDAANIKSIPFDKYEKNFTFIVNGKRYEKSRFVADLLSPIICKYHYNDETNNEFTINTSPTNTENQDVDPFEEFLKLINSEEVELNEQKRQQYGEYFLQLGNIEQYFRLVPLNVDNLTPDDIIERIKSIQKIQIREYIENENIEKMIKYASEHFYELPKEKVQTLDIEFITEILKREDLRIKSEDSLLELILELYEKDHRSSYLFEYINFSNLSRSSISKFIDSFDIEYMNHGTFKKICESINVTKENDKTERRYETPSLEFKYKKGEEFNGIMKYLSDKSGGNIHDNGTIEITSNSIGYRVPKETVDYQNDGSAFRFNNNSTPNAEICFDFKNMQVQLTSYSIKSINWNKDDDHLKSWILEVSKDGNKWEKIDEHNNDSQLNSPYAVATFNTKETNSFYRYVRLTQTGPNWQNDYHTAFSMIEFHGKLITPTSK